MSIAHLDFNLAEHANRFALHHDGWEDVARAYASTSEAIFALGLVGLLLTGLLLRRRQLTTTALLSFAASGLALLAAAAVAALVDRSRPFVAHHQIHAFLAHAADGGFPSDHATAAFAIAGVLVLRLGWRAWPVPAAALALAVSRVAIGLHYPGDVLAGALLGLAAAAVVCALAAGARGTALEERWPRAAAVLGS